MRELYSHTTWIIVPLILLLVSIGSYVGGYFFLCEEEYDWDGRFVRFYRSKFESEIFQPAARFHSLFRDQPTDTYGRAKLKGGIIQYPRPQTLPRVETRAARALPADAGGFSPHPPRFAVG